MVDDAARERGIYQALKPTDEVAAALQPTSSKSTRLMPNPPLRGPPPPTRWTCSGRLASVSVKDSGPPRKDDDDSRALLAIGTVTLLARAGLYALLLLNKESHEINEWMGGLSLIASVASAANRVLLRRPQPLSEAVPRSSGPHRRPGLRQPAAGPDSRLLAW
jgi:hypothetical protein